MPNGQNECHARKEGLSQEELEAVEISHGKIDDGLEEMKARVASLTFQIDVNEDEMRARVSSIQYTVDAWKE